MRNKPDLLLSVLGLFPPSYLRTVLVPAVVLMIAGSIGVSILIITDSIGVSLRLGNKYHWSSNLATWTKQIEDLSSLNSNAIKKFERQHQEESNRTKENTLTLNTNLLEINQIEFSDNSRYLGTSDREGNFKLFDLENTNLVKLDPDFEAETWGFDFNNNSTAIIANHKDPRDGVSESIKAWDLVNGSLSQWENSGWPYSWGANRVMSYPCLDDCFYEQDWGNMLRSDGKGLLAVTGEYIELVSGRGDMHLIGYETSEPTEIQEQVHVTLPKKGKYSNDSKYFLSISRYTGWIIESWRGSVDIFSSSGQHLSNIEGVFIDAYFADDSQEIVTIPWWGNIKVWNLQGELLRTIKTPVPYKEAVNHLKRKLLRVNPNQLHNKTVFNSSSNLFATNLLGEGNQVLVWNLDGEDLGVIQHALRIQDVKLSPDGKLVATLGLDNKIRVWTINGIPVAEYSGYRMAFNADWSKIATANPADNSVTISSVRNLSRSINLSN